MGITFFRFCLHYGGKMHPFWQTDSNLIKKNPTICDHVFLQENKKKIELTAKSVVAFSCFIKTRFSVSCSKLDHFVFAFSIIPHYPARYFVFFLQYRCEGYVIWMNMRLEKRFCVHYETPSSLELKKKKMNYSPTVEIFDLHKRWEILYTLLCSDSWGVYHLRLLTNE